LIQDDSSNNKHLACALEGETDFIVSGDYHLLDFGQFEKIKIVTVKDFLKFWQKQL